MAFMKGTFANRIGVGGAHQQFKKVGSKLYAISPRSGSGSQPWFEIKGNYLHSTEHHPDYTNINDPVFRIEGKRVMPDRGHPQGWGSTPWFEIQQ